MAPKVKITFPEKKPFLQKALDLGSKVGAGILSKSKIVGSSAVGITKKIGRVPLSFVGTIYSIFNAYFREFWYIRSGAKFDPSSKKFWAQWAHVAFFVALYVRIFGSDSLSARVTDTLLGILAGHAVAAMGWYAVGKQKDIDNSLKNNMAGNVTPGTIKATPEQEAGALEVKK